MYTKSKYFRSDIEGMRAVAILLVIGAHLAVPGFSAGFVGVDVFFVLSGYLITGILVREYQKHGRINLPRFYANRFRRLFPALATMLVVSSIAAHWLLPATQNLSQSRAAAMAAIWLSNIHFTFADIDYFAAESTTNAFVHTWSLGVEEQFYLLWPPIVLIAMKLARARLGDQQMLKLVLTSISTLSLIYCLKLAHSQPVFAFYMMPPRAWQFAAGGLVWIIGQNSSLSLMRANGLAAAGTGLLIAGLLVINQHSTYPGWLALLPTLGTCAWLWAGINNRSASHAFLSPRFMQWIGRLSYSWYLWHWPVFIIGEHLVQIRGNPVNAIGALALSLLLAIATHHLIENPIRFGRIKTTLPRWQIGVTLAAMVLLNSQFLSWHTGTETQLGKKQNSVYMQAMYDMPFFYADDCDDWYRSDKLKPCRYGSDEAPKTAVMLGDSIGVQWFPTLTQLYDADEWALIVLTKSSCPMVDEPFFYKRIGREFTECASWRDKALDWIAKNKPDTVFIGSTASSAFSDQQFVEGSKRILDRIADHADELYLIESNPVLGFNGPECLLQHHLKHPEKCATGSADNSHYKHVAKLLESVVTAYKNVQWLETASFVCPGGNCAATIDDMIVYRDSQHLTATFTASAAEHFAVQMRSLSD